MNGSTNYYGRRGMMKEAGDKWNKLEDVRKKLQGGPGGDDEDDHLDDSDDDSSSEDDAGTSDDNVFEAGLTEAYNNGVKEYREKHPEEFK